MGAPVVCALNYVSFEVLGTVTDYKLENLNSNCRLAVCLIRRQSVRSLSASYISLNRIIVKPFLPPLKKAWALEACRGNSNYVYAELHIPWYDGHRHGHLVRWLHHEVDEVPELSELADQTWMLTWVCWISSLLHHLRLLEYKVQPQAY